MSSQPATETRAAIHAELSRARQIIAILTEGPATTGEVNAETGWGIRITSAHLALLYSRGRIRRDKWETGVVNDKRVRRIWSVA